MVNTKRKNVIDVLSQMRKSRLVQAINQYLVSPWGLCTLGLFTLLSYVFALEMALYTVIVIGVIYVCVFGDDLLPILPLFVLCYVSPHAGNNPAKKEESIFLSGNGGVYLVCILSVAFLFILCRIILDKNMGLKRLFTKRRALLIGFLVLGLAYMLSGIGSDKYAETFWKNLLFGFLQFISLFLLYFLFSVAVDWTKAKKEYFFWTGLVMGIVVLGELAHIYCTQNVIENGVIERGAIYAGWGIYNNIGAMITLAIPCAMYLAVENKHGYVFITLSVLLLVGVIMSCSRASVLVAILVFLVGNVMLAVTMKYKWNMLALVVLLGVGALIGVCCFSEELTKLFMKVPDVFNPSVGGEIIFNDSNRFEVYTEGWKSYLKFPIFGDSFYPSGYLPWQVTGVEEYEKFFPPRWHNTVIQLLASCGTVGIVAYLFHRIQTIVLVAKKRSAVTAFLVLSILALLAMSLLDCHMFNIGPGFFYSMALTFLEFLPRAKRRQPQPLPEPKVEFVKKEYVKTELIEDMDER